MPAKKKPTFNFEESLKQLEGVVKRMEAGELSLEQSLEHFEQGMKLSKQLQEALTEAEQKVEILVEQNQSLSTEPFYEEDDED